MLELKNDIRKNNFVTQACSNVKLPKMVKIRQSFDPTHISVEDIPKRIRAELDRTAISQTIKPKMKIAITSGSRGVANIALVTKTVVEYLKEKGAEPFVFPAMGSHGGANAEGQLEVLKSYNVVEEYVGCPVKASMDTVIIGHRPSDGKPVYIDKMASEADGIILIGRIKAHTAFRGPYESGLLKMSVIGMGKQKGAEQVHESGFDNMGRLLPEIARVVFDNSKILFGIGLIENAFDETYKALALTPEEIWEKEPELLIEAKSKMGRILLDDLDVLIVDRIGKDVSGDGMDPNVTGKFACPNTASGGVRVQRVAVLSLTEETHHNANGVGMADITTKRLIEDTDLDVTYPNAVTSTVFHVIKLPFIVENDKTAISLAIRSCNEIDHDNPRVVRIKDTMHLKEIEISEALLEEAKKHPDIEITSEPYEWEFNENNNLW